ncbi:MAG: hypothetical protein ACTSU5_13565 [Promethearchaeota archaeon]
MEKFRPTSKVLPYKIHFKNFSIGTSISFQRGLVGAKAALRVFLDGKVYSTKTSDKIDTWEDFNTLTAAHVLELFGGQDLASAQNQRERCLSDIVCSLFGKLGFETETEPNLGHKTPDIYARRENLAWYIELKAYFGRLLCGEPEIAQALSYWTLSDEKQRKAVKRGARQQFAVTPKAMLVTTGRLVGRKDFALFKPNAVKRVRSKYFALANKIGNPKNLDDRDANGIYRSAYKKLGKLKYKKNGRVYWLYRPEEFRVILEKPKRTDVLAVPARSFAKVLEAEGLDGERVYFTRIQRTPLEKLIIDASILDFRPGGGSPGARD